MNGLSLIINFSYVISAVLFVLGLKMLGSPATARRGNALSAVGMLLAIVVTLLNQGLDYRWIVLGMAIGSLIGVLAARLVKMTAMPEMVAIFNGFGGIASLLLAWAEYHNMAVTDVTPTHFLGIVIFLSIFIGGVTFSGSMIAYARLAEKFISGKATVFAGQHIVNALLLISAVALGIFFAVQPSPQILYAIIAVAFVFGVMSVIPIGGADMPVVISLLNSYSGLAACAAGFVITNNILIVAGALVGASGIILTNIMCKAMNRSLANVLFSGFGATTAGKGKGGPQGDVKPASTEDVYYILEAASSVCFVPGYGLAVAQAQHVVRELGELLEENGADVTYAVHPVAGRMPGHMNVLLAEANVSYDKLVEMDDINPNMENVDVCVVIGANDVVNPAALDDDSSPIYGMPIIEVHRAKTVIVLKRSMNPGFAGIQNALFFCDNTRMYFGDAKASISAVVAEFKGEA